MPPIQTEIDLIKQFVDCVPPHVLQLLRYCKIKAIATDDDRELVILVPDIAFGRSLAAQPELRAAANWLGVDRLRVTNRPI
jgi:hypothetical protein